MTSLRRSGSWAAGSGRGGAGLEASRVCLCRKEGEERGKEGKEKERNGMEGKGMGWDRIG